MITTTWKSESEGKEGKRYVGKAANGGYRWCIQNVHKPQYDIAQGKCEAEDLPEEIRQKCDEYDGGFYACEWPSN